MAGFWEALFSGFVVIGIIAVCAIAVLAASEVRERWARKQEEKRKVKRLLQEVELKNYIIREIEQAQKDKSLPQLFWRFSDKKYLAIEYENSKEHRDAKWKEDKEKENATKPPF